MAMEPINLFALHKDLAALVGQLRAWKLDVNLEGTDVDWRRASVEINFGRPLSLTFLFDPAYCAEPNWSQQLRGMQNYFRAFPDTPRKAEVLAFIPRLQAAYATVWEPERMEDSDEDQRISLVCALAKALDCVLFLPSGLRDHFGRALLTSDGEYRSDAELPPYPKG